MRAWVLIMMAAALSGCASAPRGTVETPPPWRPSASSARCNDVNGRFQEVGAPAAENARAGLMHSAWPTLGSLSEMAKTGANGVSRQQVAEVAVQFLDGMVRFTGYAGDGREIALKSREWWCAGNAIMTRTLLGVIPDDGVLAARDESVLRLWIAEDGALIAEQTIESITPGRFGGSSRHRPLVRTYFRFAAAL